MENLGLMSILATDYGGMMFVMIFLTWWLIIVNLMLTTVLLVHAISNKMPMHKKSKKRQSE